MYAFIEGKVCEKTGSMLVLLAGGVGYQLICSMNTLQSAPPIGETMRCMTFFSVREDAMELYGFASAEEKALFLKLIAVSGVGPKMALALLGSMTLHDLQVAILMEDINALSRAPGIGKKTAQRIALELRDKIHQEDMALAAGRDQQRQGSVTVPSDGLTAAMEALIALGYSAAEARGALQAVKDQSQETEELISLALRAMANM